MDMLFRPERDGFRLLGILATMITSIAVAYLAAVVLLWGGLAIVRVLEAPFFSPVASLLVLGRWVALVFSGLLLLALGHAVRFFAMHAAARFPGRP